MPRWLKPLFRATWEKLPATPASHLCLTQTDSSEAKLKQQTAGCHTRTARGNSVQVPSATSSGCPRSQSTDRAHFSKLHDPKNTHLQEQSKNLNLYRGRTSSPARRQADMPKIVGNTARSAKIPAKPEKYIPLPLSPMCAATTREKQDENRPQDASSSSRRRPSKTTRS